MERYTLVISTVEDYERIIDVVKEERIKVRNAVFNAGISDRDKMALLKELGMIDYYLSSLDKRKKKVQRESK